MRRVDVPMGSEARWHMKKLARAACALSPAGRAGQRAVIRVLTFHRFARRRHDPFALEPEVFAAQMSWLAERRMALSLTEALEHLAGDRPLRESRVLITIDDGFASLHSIALPVLARHRLPAVAFVPAGWIESLCTQEGDPEPRLTWGQIRELGAGGITIGSHAWSHRSLGSLPEAEVREEVTRSRQVIEERTGHAVTAFAYPFGTRADCNPIAATALRQAGYRCGFTSQHGALQPMSDLYSLPRVKVESGDPPWLFPRLCRGGLDAWRWIDRTLCAVQARPSRPEPEDAPR